MTREFGGYQPSESEITNLQPKEGMLKVSGDGIFATLQGEGVTAGMPAVFLRLQYCNLTCGYNGGWLCDTTYTWDKSTPEYWQEPEDWSIDQTVYNLQNAWSETFGEQKTATPRVVITGGEPLLQQRKFLPIIERLPGWNVEIETNGTIKPLPQLSEFQFNCSPKLANSGNALRNRLKPQVLAHINALSNSWFKFVASSTDDLREIDQLVTDCNLSPQKILVMPEGQTAEAVSAHAQVLKAGVEDRGWQITMRNQLIWYGPKRRT